MTLSGYIPQLLEEDFSPLVSRALQKAGIEKKEISHWCIHPGGKRILDVVHKSLNLQNGELSHCYDVLRNFGNMSSATILFVLKQMMQAVPANNQKIFTAAFGPGLTMETFVATHQGSKSFVPG
jgi:predicted naringenin-chalcone synthase